MPNASITFYVGGQVILAVKADADGYYSATLKVDTADIGKPIKAVAKGAAGQAQVELVSVLPSVATLTTQAGADHIVDKTENFGVNITNVTTAEYVLSGNAATLPATDSALQNSVLNADAAEKYRLAALVKIVADGQFALPEGAATTLELATKTALVKQFIADINAKDPVLIDNTIKAIQADTNLGYVSGAEPLGQYYVTGFAPFLDARDQIFAFSALISLNPGGTGNITTATAQYALTWIKTGNKVVLGFSGLPIVASAYGGVISKLLGVPRGNNYVEGSWALSAAEFTLVDQGKIASSVVWQHTAQFVPTISNPIYQTYSLPNNYTTKLINLAKAIAPGSATIEGTWFKQSGASYGGVNSIQFAANGSATSHPVSDAAANSLFGWKLDGNKLALDSIGGGPTHTGTMYFVKDHGVGYGYVTLDNNAGVMTIDFGTLIKQQVNVALKESDLLGVWQTNDYVELFSSDHLQRANIGGPARNWSFNTATQEINYGSRCNHTRCDPTLPETEKLIAVNGKTIWSLRQAKGSVAVLADALHRWTSVDHVTEFGPWLFFSGNNANFYKATATGHEVWSFRPLNYQYFNFKNYVYSAGFDISGKAVYQDYIGSSVKIANGKLLFTHNAVASVLELLEQTEAGLKVCEYAVGASCVPSTAFWLTVKSPAKLTLAVVGKGDIGYVNPADDQDPNLQYGHAIQLKITPQFGYKIAGVGGCNGALLGDVYTTEALKTECTVTAYFVPESTATSGILAMPEMLSIPGQTFKMSKYTTTFAEYDAYAAATGQPKPDDVGWGRANRPVINVSWDDAVAYAAWLSTQTGGKFRLPSTEEWEYAARGGTTTAYYWGDDIGVGNANCNGCGSRWDAKQTAPVGSFKPNPYGLYDVVGNVFQWTQTCFDSASSCDYRTLRGGSWLFNPDDLRSTGSSLGAPPLSRDFNYGFRLVQDL